MQPEWPHVIEACAELVSVPYNDLKKFATLDGRSAHHKDIIIWRFGYWRFTKQIKPAPNNGINRTRPQRHSYFREFNRAAYAWLNRYTYESPKQC
ncbi:MAG: hypothetical protein WKF84_04125 [Pyrinomonadaceae bacterium]